ncbi:MAG: hypothetical protein A3E80_05640 [Chlamydiae bacterium RIFCSPHIGHO2_12_FULL_49_9]|nr:MAG: hypothetical protein A3E80_05640 [Chlamydiae bacterium RIFCSPHIGHO2_12_FULL_49_9]
MAIFDLFYGRSRPENIYYAHVNLQPKYIKGKREKSKSVSLLLSTVFLVLKNFFILYFANI